MSTYLQLLFPEVNQSQAVELAAQAKHRWQQPKPMDFSCYQSSGKYQVIRHNRVIKRFNSFYEAYQYGLHQFKSHDFVVL